MVNAAELREQKRLYDLQTVSKQAELHEQRKAALKRLYVEYVESVLWQLGRHEYIDVRWNSPTDGRIQLKHQYEHTSLEDIAAGKGHEDPFYFASYVKEEVAKHLGPEFQVKILKRYKDSFRRDQIPYGFSVRLAPVSSNLVVDPAPEAAAAVVEPSQEPIGTTAPATPEPPAEQPQSPWEQLWAALGSLFNYYFGATS